MNIPESMSGLVERPRAMWEEAPPVQRYGIIGGAAALLIGLIVAVVLFAGGDEEWEPAILYTGLEFKEAAEITTRLDELGIPYRLTGDASTIVVPAEMKQKLLLSLAGEGFPRSGRLGYEIFDKSQLAMTDFLQKVNLRRALQEELEKTLLHIEGVRNVRVHLVTPEPSLFTEEQNPVTASVTLTLASGLRLKPEQINAIGQLVSASVEGLEIDKVVIVDSRGAILSEDQDPLSKMANKQFRFKQQVERSLEKKVQSLMDEVIGKERSKVRIDVKLDFSQRNTHLRSVDPGESQVVISEETNEKTSAEQGSEEQAVRNYEVNETVQNIIGSVGTIERLSMALTVDKTKVVPDMDNPGEFIIEDRPQAEIDRLARLAQQAVGFSGERGDQLTVFAMPFDKSQEIQQRQAAERDESTRFWTNIAINVAKVLGILAALVTLRFIIQAIGRGVGVEEDIEVLGEMAGEVEEEEFERPETPHDIILSRLQQMVRERPEDSAKLIRTMLVEEASNA